MLNATAFNQSKTDGYKSALSTISNVPECWISISDVTAYNLNPNGSLGSVSGSRRLLQIPDEGLLDTAPAHRQLLQTGQVGAALGVNAFLPSNDGNGVLNLLNNSYGDGVLANGIAPAPLLLQLLSVTPEGVSTMTLQSCFYCVIYLKIIFYLAAFFLELAAPSECPAFTHKCTLAKYTSQIA